MVRPTFNTAGECRGGRDAHAARPGCRLGRADRSGVGSHLVGVDAKGDDAGGLDADDDVLEPLAKGLAPDGTTCAFPRTSIMRGCHGGSTSSITMLARPVRCTSRSFLVWLIRRPPTSIASCSAL